MGRARLFMVDVDSLQAELTSAVGKTIASVDRVQDTVLIDFADGTRLRLGPPE